MRVSDGNKDNSNSLDTYNENTKILAITATDDEDKIYCTTRNGQLISGRIQLQSDEERKEVPAQFNYVMGPFHKDEITGLDVCIRKELIATCSKDKTVSIWNYATRSHEVSNQYGEECQAVAFHPSGLHLIVAFVDKISVCNILS